MNIYVYIYIYIYIQMGKIMFHKCKDTFKSILNFNRYFLSSFFNSIYD